MKLLFWRIRLCYWLLRCNYCSAKDVFEFSGDECWIEPYYDNEDSPREAIYTDLSYM